MPDYEMIGKSSQGKRQFVTRIQGLESQVKEQNERICHLSRLIVHLVKVQGKDLPPRCCSFNHSPFIRGSKR